MITSTRAAPLHPRPSLVLFDLDNTICDYHGARIVRTRYAFEPHFPELERLELAVNAAMAHNTDGSEHFVQVLAAHGITDPTLVEEVRARYIDDRYRGLVLYDDALEVIETVRQDFRVGMITNGPRAIQRPKIELLSIETLFPVIVVSEEVGVWKPDPEIFRIALERCGCGPDDAIYVGDSVEHDIPGAHAAGMRAVWVNRHHIEWPGASPPDAVIHDLSGLLPLLGLAQGQATATA